MVASKRYARLWLRMIEIHFSIIATSRIDFFTYLAGKSIRMGFFLLFVEALFARVPTIVGYTKGEVLLFFAVMNFIDILIQLLWYRGMTDLARVVRNGDFDSVLTKPMSPLFWSAFRIFDFFDLTTLPIAFSFLFYAFHELSYIPSPSQIFIGLFLFILSLFLAFAINLLLASLTFWSTEVDNTWWIFRDTIYIARFPPEIFPKIIRLIFTCIVPILVIVTFPTKGLLGLLSPVLIGWACVTTVLTFCFALSIWHKALAHYSSASS